jgi:hypothetical protein
VSFLRHVWAETRKSVHPVALVLVALTTGATLAFANTTERLAAGQVPVSEVNSVLLERDVDPRCLADRSDRTPDCVISRANHHWNERFRIGGRQLGGVARAVQSTTPGALSFVAGHFASGLGWLLAFGLAALLVAGEWQFGSASTTLLANPRLGRFLLAKGIGIWTLSVAVMLATGLLLAAAHALAPGRFPTVRAPDLTGLTLDEVSARFEGRPMAEWAMRPVDPDRHWSSPLFAAERLGVAALVLLAFCLVAVVVAAQLRRPLPVVIVGTAFLLALAQLGGLGAFSPMNAVAAAMEFANTPYGVRDRFLWTAPGAMDDLYAIPRPPTSALVVALAWSAAVMALVVASRSILALRDRV